VKLLAAMLAGYVFFQMAYAPAAATIEAEQVDQPAIVQPIIEPVAYVSAPSKADCSKCVGDNCPADCAANGCSSCGPAMGSSAVRRGPVRGWYPGRFLSRFSRR